MDQEEDTQDELLDSSVFTIVSDEPQAPRLRIAHLMLWMLCSAVFLTMIDHQWSDADTSTIEDFIRDAANIIQGILCGALLAALSVVLYARYRNGTSGLRHPGHWYLLIVTVDQFVIVFLDFEILFDYFFDWVLLGYLMIDVFAVVGYFLAVKSVAQQAWKVVFSFSLLASFSYLISSLDSYFLESVLLGEHYWDPFLIIACVELLFCPWILMVAIIDKRNGVQRDWLHWVGLICYVFKVVLYLMWQIPALFA